MKTQLSLKSYGRTIIVCLLGLFIVNLFFSFFPAFWSQMFLGKAGFSFSPTFQDLMWVIFIIGITQVFERKVAIKKIQSFRSGNYLPEDFEVIIDDEVLTNIIRSVKDDAKEDNGVLPYMVLQMSLQFRTNNSISITSDFLSKQLELFLHEIELNYNKLKYIIWLIPSLGFMGTVYGIGLAVSQLGEGSLDDPELLTKMAGSLGVAFNTTLVALVLSVILQYLAQHFEAKEERQINDFGKYIMDNLINKLVEKR